MNGNIVMEVELSSVQESSEDNKSCEIKQYKLLRINEIPYET